MRRPSGAAFLRYSKVSKISNALSAGESSVAFNCCEVVAARDYFERAICGPYQPGCVLAIGPAAAAGERPLSSPTRRRPYRRICTEICSSTRILRPIAWRLRNNAVEQSVDNAAIPVAGSRLISLIQYGRLPSFRGTRRMPGHSMPSLRRRGSPDATSHRVYPLTERLAPVAPTRRGAVVAGVGCWALTMIWLGSRVDAMHNELR